MPTSHDHEAGGSGWTPTGEEGGDSDSEGLPPPMPPHPMTGLEELTNQVRGINIRTDELQTAFNSHVQGNNRMAQTRCIMATTTSKHEHAAHLVASRKSA